MPFFRINRIAYTRDGMALRFPLRDHAAQQIHLIALGKCDQDIRMLQIRILQDAVAGAVPYDAHDIVHRRHVPDTLRIHIYHDNIMMFLR